MTRVAVIDDDAAVLDALRLYFARQDLATACFAGAEDFLAWIKRGDRFDCIVCDVRMPKISGLDLVQRLKAAGFSAPVILITGHGDVDMALLARTGHATYCPYKGDCAYYSIPSGGERSTNAAWTYEAPYAAVARIKDHLAFYSDRVDAIEIGPVA